MEESTGKRTKAGLGDDQGTRVGAPDQGDAKPPAHSDGPSTRPEKQTGTGSEATEGSSESGAVHPPEHRSGYGGEGGTPVMPSDSR